MNYPSGVSPVSELALPLFAGATFAVGVGAGPLLV
jgi:hypothetical protein